MIQIQFINIEEDVFSSSMIKLFVDWLNFNGKKCLIVDSVSNGRFYTYSKDPRSINPNEFTSRMVASINTDSCIHCNICIENCSYGSISNSGMKYRSDPFKCTACGDCIEVCPVDCIVLSPMAKGYWYISDYAMNKILYAKVTNGIDDGFGIAKYLLSIADQVDISKDFDFLVLHSSVSEESPLKTYINLVENSFIIIHPLNPDYPNPGDYLKEFTGIGRRICIILTDRNLAEKFQPAVQINTDPDIFYLEIPEESYADIVNKSTSSAISDKKISEDIFYEMLRVVSNQS